MSAFKSSDAPILREPTEDNCVAGISIATAALAGLVIATGPIGAIVLTAISAGSIKYFNDCDKRSNQLDRVLKIRK